MEQSNPDETNMRPSDSASGVDNVENEGASDNFRQCVSGETNPPQEETKVIYHIDEEETPYKVTVRTSVIFVESKHFATK
jgi:hypothetical protein